jgi:hypothetical protein
LGATEVNPRKVGLEQRFHMLHEGSRLHRMELLWHLHDEYGSTE